MIVYATKKTVERYKIKMPEELSDPLMRSVAMNVYKREHGDRLMEWGAKIFYFDRRKCIQVCNFASKFILVLVDFKIDDLQFVANAIAEYMFDIYANDRQTTALLRRFFTEYPIMCFSKLTDRSIIATLNQTQVHVLADGYALYDFLSDNILHTREINKIMNKDFPVKITTNGKEEYVYAADVFAKLLKERYRK